MKKRTFASIFHTHMTARFGDQKPVFPSVVTYCPERRGVVISALPIHSRSDDRCGSRAVLGSAIARALAMSPEVMLFDEVTSALDLELVGEVLAVMRQFGEDGTTMIVVTHEIALARDIADHVLFMDAGAIAEHGPADEVLVRPANPRTRAFLTRFHHAAPPRSAG